MNAEGKLLNGANETVFNEITEAEIMAILMRGEPDDEEAVRLNGKCVWETAKGACEFINTHEDIITITTFAAYRAVMKNVMNVINEAHDIERKRRMASRKGKSEETKERTQRGEALIAEIKQGKRGKKGTEGGLTRSWERAATKRLKLEQHEKRSWKRSRR